MIYNASYAPNPRSFTRQGLGLFKMLVLMVLMAGMMFFGFGVYANWNIDADKDGQPDGFTLRIFDSSWYGTARDQARPLAQDAKAQLLSIRDKVMDKGGLLDQGDDIYESLMHTDAAENNKKNGGHNDRNSDGHSIVHTNKKPANKQKILHGNKTKKVDSWDDASNAVQSNDPEGAYKFDATKMSEKPTLHLEDDILEAGEHFAVGKASYLSAYDHDKELRDDYAVHMKKSQNELKKAHALLAPAVAEYAQRSDADPHMKLTSQRLLQAIDKLLADAYVQKSS